MSQPHSRMPEITLVNGTPREQQTRDQLVHVLEQYPLDKWLYTEQIQIDRNAIPHSHPILTLHTKHLDDAQQLISTYIHEQIHWFLTLVEHFEDGGKAMNTFRQIYPQLPIGIPDGCGDEFSNYLHIPVNYLEYRGLIELFGDEIARQILERKDYYKKIYALVLDETGRIGDFIKRYGQLLPERPPEPKEFIQFENEP